MNTANQVDEGDGLPNNICHQCIACITAYEDLNRKCTEVYELLGEIASLRYYNQLSNPGDISPDSIDSEEIITEEVVANHSKSYHNTGKTEENPESNEYLQFNRSEQSLMRKIPKKAQECPICHKTISQLKKHMITHTSIKEFSCTYCTKQFALRRTLQRHILAIHLKQKPHKCGICTESFADSTSLRYHDLVKHKGVRNFLCELCNKYYHTSSELQQHKSLTHVQRRFECSYCGKMFAMKHHLKDHLIVHSKTRDFECNICKKRFSRQGILKKHMFIHEN
ncbi:gastrula zinc finger protein XlCGF71.1-like isoform X2 [Uranotaenia lowii]|uniref:gastrula zinc finger protein XlCGF71.1-like isoform X2 n=1 Tax=Uranotaenia lowii TaxID=190385 RepID=UPI002479A3D0|nr:gastrula zinc finger protein XlCGF71.1-like isoform X2 [Uranotaenia lowii]